MGLSHPVQESAAASPEVWGGAECTRNRVGDGYFDQMNLSGHTGRLDDVERFAGLGIKALRCGMLWERHELDPSWRWEDRYLSAVCDAGMRPIVGLMHHGSGPADTSLLDTEFPYRLAQYAGDFAVRYPFVDRYTPVNEPHTTARFACRSGVWYPHKQCKSSYLRALLLQVKATVLSMEAIRRVQPDAQLVQTDDTGRTWSTPELQATADLLTERRWLPYDLLCGTVQPGHPLYRYLLDSDLSEAEVLWFRDHPCPPDVVGLNYYTTSDRFLDHRQELYPPGWESAEGPFVDVEAVRVRPEGIQTFGTVLREAYARYDLPVALTEVHLGDRAEEQIRWAGEAWEGARAAAADGIPCCAVTFWALLGSYFWNELVTADNGHYETGAFDLRGGRPTETALANVIRQCARGTGPQHQALDKPGWWRRSDRFAFLIPEEMVA